MQMADRRRDCTMIEDANRGTPDSRLGNDPGQRGRSSIGSAKGTPPPKQHEFERLKDLPNLAWAALPVRYQPALSAEPYALALIASPSGFVLI